MRWTREANSINERPSYVSWSGLARYRIIPSPHGYQLYCLPNGTTAWGLDTTCAKLRDAKEMALKRDAWETERLCETARERWAKEATK